MRRSIERLTAPDRARLYGLMALEREHDTRREAATGWSALARPEQRPPPGDWRSWLILAGRGWGKTRTGAETISRWVADGLAYRIAVVAQTAADARDVSVRALLAAAPGARFEPSKRRVVWSGGAEAIVLSAEEPDSLRGHEFDTAWSDEIAAWPYPDAFDQLQFGLRVGWARQIATTTPRPVRVVRELVADPTTVVTRGRTLDNAANLDESTIRYYLARYGGTRLGRQELDAELLDDVPGALWTRARIDELRVGSAPEFTRIVVAIDPAVSSAEEADETGIVVAAKGIDGAGYVLADLSCRASPDGWARRAVDACRLWGADRIVGEANQGGDLVEATIRTVDPTAPYRAVHASKGKRRRAEPIAALYEQGRVHHVGAFPTLEDQLCAALPDRGTGPDDRLDALVWGLTELGLAGADLDVPGMISWMLGVWTRPRCQHMFSWAPRRPCPRCRTPAAEDYSTPVPPPSD